MVTTREMNHRLLFLNFTLSEMRFRGVELISELQPTVAFSREVGLWWTLLGGKVCLKVVPIP